MLIKNIFTTDGKTDMARSTRLDMARSTRLVGHG